MHLLRDEDGLNTMCECLLAAADDVTEVGDTQQEKAWGREFSVMLDDCLTKVITVLDGHRTSLQYHEYKEEVIIVLTGDGGVQGGEGEWLCRAGQSIRIKPGVIHRTVGPVILLEFQTNHPHDVVRIEDDYGRATT